MRIGIVGLRGHVGDCLKGASQWKGAKIVAVSDVDKEEVAKLCTRSGLATGAEQFTDWKHLVEHAMIDVAIVADENVVRADQLVALAERGVHICAEKPLSTTLDDLARVRKAVDASKVKLTM